ncbi:MAG TPA: glycosyltransferase family 2 protein [Candidatus Diapherotrites archaeon]|nr:glycosyltransferase family 2 protein [Candidatus Diapherotrites archaeon]
MKTIKDRLFVLFLLSIAIFIFILLISSYSIFVLIIGMLALYFAILFLLVFFIYPKTSKRQNIPKVYPNVAVVTYAFNNWKPIEETIKNLLKLKYPKPLDIYVITDGSCDFLKKYPIKIITIPKKYFKNRLNVKATIMNIGLKKINTDYFFCVDGDTIPKPDALMKMIPFLEEKGVVVVNGFLVPSNNDNLISKIQTIEYNFSWGLFQRIMGAMDSISVAVGGMCLIQKKAFHEIGGYDENNVTEDRELVYRLREKGYKFRFSEESRGYTEVPTTHKQLIKQRLRWYYGEIDTATKHRKFYLNKKYNMYGLFILPYTLFMQIISIAILFRLVHFIYKKYVVFYYHLLVQMIKQSYFTKLPFIFPNYLPSTTFFWLIIFVISMFLIYVGFTHSKFNLKPRYYFAFFIYLFFYNLYLGVIYLIAMIQNIIGDFKWEKS